MNKFFLYFVLLSLFLLIISTKSSFAFDPEDIWGSGWEQITTPDRSKFRKSDIIYGCNKGALSFPVEKRIYRISLFEDGFEHSHLFYQRPTRNDLQIFNIKLMNSYPGSPGTFKFYGAYRSTEEAQACTVMLRNLIKRTKAEKYVLEIASGFPMEHASQAFMRNCSTIYNSPIENKMQLLTNNFHNCDVGTALRNLEKRKKEMHYLSQLVFREDIPNRITAISAQVFVGRYKPNTTRCLAVDFGYKGLEWFKENGTTDEQKYSKDCLDKIDPVFNVISELTYDSPLVGDLLYGLNCAHKFGINLMNTPVQARCDCRNFIYGSCDCDSCQGTYEPLPLPKYSTWPQRFNKWGNRLTKYNIVPKTYCNTTDYTDICFPPIQVP